jgi:hypothetical protein
VRAVSTRAGSIVDVTPWTGGERVLMVTPWTGGERVLMVTPWTGGERVLMVTPWAGGGRVLRAPTCTTMVKVTITKSTDLISATGLGTAIRWTVITVYFGITAGTLIFNIEVNACIYTERFMYFLGDDWLDD